MKKLQLNFMLVILTLSFSISHAQSDDEKDPSTSKSKLYLGVGLGFAAAGGDIGDEVKTGLNLNFLNLGYRFSETWGATFNISSSGHVLKDNDAAAIGVAYFGIGPMYTVSLSESINWDIKPQYSFGMTGKIVSDDNIVDDIDYKGNGFVFGNSLVFGGGNKGFKFSIDLDYMSGKFNEAKYSGITVDIDEDNKLTNFKLGVGIRYNF